jgi:hypothetical protein
MEQECVHLLHMTFAVSLNHSANIFIYKLMLTHAYIHARKLAIFTTSGSCYFFMTRFMTGENKGVCLVTLVTYHAKLEASLE